MFGLPRWIDGQTVEYTARIDCDVLQIIHGSVEGSLMVVEPVEAPLPEMTGAW